MRISAERQKILDNIEDYERRGLFDVDVAEDPPTKPLDYTKVDYTYRRLSTKLFAFLANRLGQAHFEGMLRRGEAVIREIRGQEHLEAIKGRGALITCNHFNPFDNYAVYKALCPALGGRMLYKIIREGNYTSFGGFYGFLFRHCNTLPLSASTAGMKHLLSAVSTLLVRGEKILIYPEQAMWLNYRKPRPCKTGAFHLAAKNGAPVLPLFITMSDTERLDPDGLPIQAYTIHILPPVFPKEVLSQRENTAYMCRENGRLWKEAYEGFYGEPLRYTTEGEVEICSI